ncbi:chromate transporter [Ideonella sp. BN130291]|uniref:chromate transporter n=1 Tax=Ideonella sp. BN130291 TaxID=3112940 RepID=UPI002E26C819|nr:chromate transporter [Ideonella sp. BN130291]
MSWLAAPWPLAHGLSLLDLLGLFAHFLVLSMLAIGGAITTAPDMHRLIVKEHGWITDAQFTASVALAQAAPGPNLLFVAVLGWNVAGLPGVVATMAGILLPSTTLALAATRWGGARRDALGVRAFTNGMAPLTLGLLLATGWVLSEPSHGSRGATALVVLTVLVIWRTGLSPMWMIGVGAVVGGLGWA